MMSPDDRHVLEDMVVEYISSPPVYRPSKFWDNLNQLNAQWLIDDGINNFKRSVNNNYFNWMVGSRSPYFQAVTRQFVQKLPGSARNLPGLLKAHIDEMRTRTYLSRELTDQPFLKRRLYALYLCLLYDYVRDHDSAGLFDRVEEPMIGNPITVMYRGRRISQDICNSYLEYQYLRKGLGSVFDKTNVIAEIGSGYGRLMYLLHMFHNDSNRKLIIVDIPPALFVAQWYLHKVFPNTPKMFFRSFGCFADVEKELNKANICFLLPHQLEMLPDKYINVLINISSLQEMRKDQIAHYYDLINQKSQYFYTKQWTFWENPEDKIVVPAVIYPTKPEWDVMTARLHPIHTDFFEAIFKL